MKIQDARLAAMAVRQNQYPPEDMPEIAVTGRSNVGKSTLLNYLTGRKGLAYVSSTPGKTRTINFYEINGAFRIIDLPGYGYARRSKQEADRWDKMMDSFLTERRTLLTVLQLIDSRHDPTKLDIQMYEYLRYYHLDGPVILTKSDKLTRAQLGACEGRVRKILEVRPEVSVIPCSALKKTGREEILDTVEGILKRAEQKED